MKTHRVLRTVLLSACGLLLAAHVSYARLSSLDSSTDGNGVFTYTLSPADDTLVFGGDSNLTLRIASYMVMSVSNPPGWTSEVDAQSFVTWRPTNSAAYLVDDSLEFTLVCGVTETMTYDKLEPDADYPQGTVAGYVYETNGVYYQPDAGSTTGGVYSVNIAGFERFAYVGPAIPEPAILLGLIPAALLLLRRRR